MKARIKESVTIFSIDSTREFNAEGLTGVAQQQGTSTLWEFYFDEKSTKRLPKWWFKEAEKYGYDPTYYIVKESEIEFI